MFDVLMFVFVLLVKKKEVSVYLQFIFLLKIDSNLFTANDLLQYNPPDTLI